MKVRYFAVALAFLAFAVVLVGAVVEERRHGPRQSCFDSDNLAVVVC